MRLAWFISPHGLGHAARQCAVIAALRARRPDLEVSLFTRVPPAFFEESGIGSFTYHEDACDLGLVQRSPVEEDLPATLARLADLLPFAPPRVRALADILRADGCRGVICDIAPLGLAAAGAAGIPSLLVENFTWDWIYDGYTAAYPAMVPYVGQMHDAFARADWRVQTEPVCRPHAGADTVGVVSRAPRTPRAEVRQRLGQRPDAPAVLITGGVLPGTRAEQARQLAEAPEIDFLIVGGREPAARAGAVHFLPQHSDLYHPDLVHAVDGVVAKLGYSTVAECYHAGVLLAYLTRPRFRESGVLEHFVRTAMATLALDADAWMSGHWVRALPPLLAAPRPPPAARPPNGADTLADRILARWT